MCIRDSHLPEGRRYGVVAGTGRILDALEHFHLDEADLKFLADRHVVSPETIKWLENFHFSGTIRGYREGEMFFPNSPILQVEGTFGECTLLETFILSVLNYDSAVASAASRMASAAKDRPCMDMGGRRTNEWAAVAAARAAVVGGFKGTANLLAAQLYGLKAIGTAAHLSLIHISRSNLRYRNGPRGIFNSCHGMFLVPFVCWLELFVTGVIRVTDVAGVAGVTGLRDSRSASGAASVRGPRAGALPAR